MTGIGIFRTYTLPGLLPALLSGTVTAAADGPSVVRLHQAVDSPYYPIMIRGDILPMLHTVPVRNISVMADHGNGFEAVPFQIDRLDENSQYQLDPAFMAADAGDNGEGGTTLWAF